MKGKTKTQKGITLVALIITIVVLLILAVVAITSIQNEGILAHSNNAVNAYLQNQLAENTTLNEYENFLNKYAGTQTYTAYEVGDKVTIKNGDVNEEFYVIEASDETQANVVLLAKECIDTTNLVQSADADQIAFSSTNYWSSIEGITYPYDLVETGEPSSDHYAAYAAYQYGVKLGGTGRLMYYSEAVALYSSYRDWLNEPSSHWLGYADSETDLIVTYGTNTDLLDNATYDGDMGEFGVCLVVEISKSKIS